MNEETTENWRAGHESVRSTAKEQKEQVVSKTLTARSPKAKVQLAKTVPLVLSFSEGPTAGTIKFVAAGDVYQDNTGKVQRYANTKIVIKTTVMKDAFTITEPLYRFMMAAFEDTDAQGKIAEWLE